MRRVLVIQDVGLWIDLNRHLSGVASVDLVEAVSFETGQLLAQIERPEIVVYGRDGDGPGAQELARELIDAGLAEIQVIAIDSKATDVDDALARRGPSSRPIVCKPDRLFELVSELLAQSPGKPDPGVELLAHYELDDVGGGTSRGFAVILELSDRHVAFESDESLEAGTELRMNFFLADPSGRTERVKISMTCAVVQCRDEAKLIYSARISKIPEAARRALQHRAELGRVGGA